MFRTLTTFLLLLLFTSLVGPGAKAQEAEWGQANKEGMRALAEKRYADAERLFRQAVKAAEKIGKNDLRVAESLTNLSAACYARGKPDCNLSALRRALKIRIAALGPEHADVATTWEHLGGVFLAREAVEVSGVLTFQEFATITPMPNAPDFATSFLLSPFRFDPLSGPGGTNFVVSLSRSLKETESCLKKALAIREKILPASHPDLMRSLHRLGWVYLWERKLEPAEQLFVRLLELKEKNFGSGHLEFAATLGDLARAYYFGKKFAEAASHYGRALTIYEQTPETDPLVLAGCLFNLGEVYHAQKRYFEAEPFYVRALGVIEKARGADNPNALPILRAYAELLDGMGRKDDARKAETRAQTIRNKALAARP